MSILAIENHIYTLLMRNAEIELCVFDAELNLIRSIEQFHGSKRFSGEDRRTSQTSKGKLFDK